MEQSCFTENKDNVKGHLPSLLYRQMEYLDNIAAGRRSVQKEDKADMEYH